MRNNHNKILAGFAFAMMATVSTGAMADCTGTGLGGALSPILPFASGGQVASLISAINTANTAFLTQSTAFVSAPGNPAPGQEGGGIWARAIGGEVKTKTTSTTSNITLGGLPAAGTVTCNNVTRLNFAGAQAGTDIARLNWGGWNVHVGATAGYLGARAKDISSIGPLNPLGGTFQDTLQVPFAGVYVAATQGGFFVDGQLRFDYYQNSLNDPIVSGLFDQKLDARGVSGTGNIGYNFQLGNNWFIEPSAGLVVSRVKVDPLNVSGTLIIPTAPGFTLPGRLQIDDIKSELGRLSLRAGTVVSSGGIIWQPFATASVYHEFEGNVRSSFADAVLTGVGASGNISSTNIGTYGQFGVGVAAQIPTTGWLGYLRGDYRTGSNIEGYSLNGGIRYQFSPEAIAAAPLYTKAPVKAPAAVVRAYDWTGFFIGGSFGALYGHQNWAFQPLGTQSNPRFAGALGGGQIGYDRQFGKWVLGVEGALYATNAHGADSCPNGTLFTCEDKVNWIGTATGKVGYALWDRSLWYIRGGAAFAESKVYFSCNTGATTTVGFPPLVPFTTLVGCGQSDQKTKAGWTVGFGSEFALSKHWTVRSETNYFDLGTSRFTVPLTAATSLPIDVKQNGFISTIGLNYRFSPDTVIAKY